MIDRSTYMFSVGMAHFRIRPCTFLFFIACHALSFFFWVLSVYFLCFLMRRTLDLFICTLDLFIYSSVHFYYYFFFFFFSLYLIFFFFFFFFFFFNFFFFFFFFFLKKNFFFFFFFFFF